MTVSVQHMPEAAQNRPHDEVRKGHASNLGARRRPNPSSECSKVLLVITFFGIICPDAQAQQYSLRIVEDSSCNGLTTWNDGCRMNHGEEIPSIKIGLFEDGVACCGQAQVAVNVQARKGETDQGLNGFVDRDSVPSGAGTAMSITFDGLRLSGQQIGANFSLTFSAFYEGQLLRYTTEHFTVFPNGIALQQPWGSWPGVVSSESTTDPFMVGEELPPISVALTISGASGNETATSLTSGDHVYVGARLFHKADSTDVSEEGLLGGKVKLVSEGVAVFNDLRIRKFAGKGYKLSFYVLTSEKACVPSILRLQCEEWEKRRGPDGGLGGYELELETQEITITPDTMVVSTFGTHPRIVRVDETIYSYRVQFFDSTNPSDVLSGFASKDGFSVTASLFNSAGSDISASLSGTRTRDVNGTSADFDDLYISGRAGDGHYLQFKPSWYSQCQADLFDLSCSGGCCVKSTSFFVYPYRMEVSQTATNIEVGASTPSITVNFLDFSGAVLSVITASDGLVLNAFLKKRNVFASGLTGSTTLTVNAGTATFGGLAISNNAGSGFTILFVEEKSQMSGSTNIFAIYPSQMVLSTSQTTATTGGPLQNAQISLQGPSSELLTYIQPEDLFVVSFEALQYSGGSYVSSTTLVGVTNATVNDGIALMDGSQVSITGVTKVSPGFKLKCVLPRDGLSDLSVESSSFDVAPQSISLLTGGFAQKTVGSATIDAVTISLLDLNSNTIGAEAENVPIQVSLLKGSTDLSSFLNPSSSVLLGSSGTVVLSGRTIQSPAAGSNFYLQFSTPTGQTADTSSETFDVVSFQISVSHGALATIAGTTVPSTITVALQDSNSSTLTTINGEFDVTGEAICGGGSVTSPVTRSANSGIATFTNDIVIDSTFGDCYISFQDLASGNNAVSSTFLVDPPAMVLTGFSSSSVRVGDNVSAEITMTDQDGDNNGNGVADDKLSQASSSYTFQVSLTLFKGSQDVSHYLASSTSVQVMDAIARFNDIRFNPVAGKNFSFLFTMNTPSAGLLQVASSTFSIYPDQLTVLSVTSGLSDTVLPAIPVVTQRSGGQFIPISVSENFRVQAKLFDHSNTLIPWCSTSAMTNCLSGNVNLTINNGSVTFTDLLVRDRAGNNFYFRFEMLGGGPTGVSPFFSIYPGALVIAEGRTDFTGKYLVSNRDAGVYSTRLETPGTGAHALHVTAGDGFNISVSLIQRGVDLTRYLAGTLSQVADYNETTQVHATFTDLRVLGLSGSDFILRFKFVDPQASNDLVIDTGNFRIVPYALRIQEACYNGISINTTGLLPFGAPPLVCSGTDATATAQFGSFGYLTGYYYYAANQVVGPLLRNVRGRARVPTITVLASDLYENLLTLIQANDNLQINAGLFKNTEDFTSLLSGTTSQTIVAGSAEFSDLVVGSIPGCSPNCTVVLRFSLNGALCTDTWCTNVTMDLRDAAVIPPHQLGSHPGYPGKNILTGTVIITSLDRLSSTGEAIFKQAIVTYSSVVYQTTGDVTLTSVTNQSSGGNGLEVSFTVAARTYAAANTMQVKLTGILDAGNAIFFSICQKLGQTNDTLCNETTTLKEPLERSTESLLFASRVATPTFLPAGSSASCVTEGNCFTANISSFGSFSVVVSAGSGTTVYYTVDTCPTPTVHCTSIGSVPSLTSPNVTSGVELTIFQSTPPSTILAVGLTTSSAFTNPGQASGFGATGTRQSGVMPSVFTIKAFGFQDGKKQGFQSSTTYALPSQAATPEITLLEKYVLGWCNGTHVSNGSGVVRGSCEQLHANSSFCTAATVVPCLAAGSICTSGSAGSTIASTGYYDGSYEEQTAVTLTVAYAPNMDRVYVSSVAALGFTNDGTLPTPTRILVGANGQGGVFPALQVLSVSLADNSLGVQPDLETTSAVIGSTVELLEMCNITDVTSSVRLFLATATSSAKVYFNLDGSSPTSASTFITGSSSLSFKPPAMFRGVAAEDGRMNSFLLSADFANPCGDGNREGGEECDDGNEVSGDGCSSECLKE